MEEFSYLIPSGENKVTEKPLIFSLIGRYFFHNLADPEIGCMAKLKVFSLSLFCLFCPSGQLFCRHSDSWTVFFL